MSARAPRALFRALTVSALLLVTVPLVTATTAQSARAWKDGFYIGFGFGGGIQLGAERGIGLTGGGCPPGNGYFLWHEPPSNTCRYAASQAQYEEISRTEFGEGFGIHFRLGYNILGHVSVEASVSGHGDVADFQAGSGVANFQVRWHFLKLLELAEVVTPEDRSYDADIMVGVGYAIGGYTPSQSAPGITGDDEKGWEGLNVSFGLAFKYMVQPWMSVGVDLTFLFPMYSSFIANWDEDYRSEPVDGTAGATSLIPSFTITFHP